MLGVLLLSEYNELVHAFGNAPFRAHFAAAPDDGCPTQRPVPSSSGVSSPSTSSSTSVDHRRHHGHSAGKNGGDRMPLPPKKPAEGPQFEEHPLLDSELLLQLVMPLALLCRREHKAQALRSIEADDRLHLRVTHLAYGNLLALIHEQGSLSNADRLFRWLRRCVSFHYGGPSLQLVPLDSPLVRQMRQRCEHRMLALLAEESANAADPFCLNAAFDVPARVVQTTLLPHFRELAQRISHAIGRRCRCLFLLSGHLAASASSHSGETTLSALRREDLRSLAQFARQSPADALPERCLKCHAEMGVWLHSKSRRRRLLHNVFCVSLSDCVEMVCLVAADHCQLIGCIGDALESLEQFGDFHASDGEQERLAHSQLLQACERQLSAGQKLLGAMVAERGAKKVADLPSEGFPRAQQLIQHLWTRFRNAFSAFHQQEGPLLEEFAQQRHLPLGPAPSLFSQGSWLFGRLSSSLSRPGSSASFHHQNTVSSTASTARSMGARSSCGGSSRVSGAHLDAMRAQLRKVLRSLLNDLLSANATLARSQTLVRLQQTVRQSMDAPLASALKNLGVAAAPHSEGPLRPAALGFDMLAFRFTRTEPNSPQMHFQHATGENESAIMALLADEDCGDELHSEDDDDDEAVGAGGSEEFALARTAEGELLIQLSGPIPPSTQQHERRKAPSAGGNYRCAVLFSRHVNTALALRQTNGLMCALGAEMDRAMANFQ